MQPCPKGTKYDVSRPSVTDFPSFVTSKIYRISGTADIGNFVKSSH